MKKLVALSLVLAILLCSVPALAADRAYYLGIDFEKYTEEWLEKHWYDASKTEAILVLAGQAQELKTKLIDTIVAHTEQSEDEAEKKVNEIIELMTVKSIYEYMVKGSKLSKADVAAFQQEKKDLSNTITYISVNMRSGKSSMTAEEWAELAKLSYSTQLQYAIVSYYLDGASVSKPVIDLIKTEQSTVSGTAMGTIINAIFESDLTREQKDEINTDFSNLGELSALLMFIVNSKLI